MANELHINIWNGGWVNLFEKQLTAIHGELVHEAMPEISKATAEYAASRARSIVRNGHADIAYDGNKIDSVTVESTGSRSSVYMNSPKKPGSQYSDAVYVEYGYGPKGVYSHFNNDADFVATRPAGYEPSEGSNKIRYNPWYDAEGWYFYNQHHGGRLQWSEGAPALAPMYRSKKSTLNALKKPTSALNKRIHKIIDKAIAKATL